MPESSIDKVSRNLPVKLRAMLLLLTLMSLLALIACRAEGNQPTPTAGPTIDPALADRWDYEGYAVDGATMIVYARVYSQSSLQANLDGDPPTRTEGGDEAGLMTFRFNSVGPGRHALRVGLSQENFYAQGAWMPPSGLGELPPGEKLKLLPGQGFKARGEDFTILYTGTYADSRCPAGVTCIWAGETAHQFTGIKKGQPVIESLVKVPNGQVGTTEVTPKYAVSVHSVSPGPKAGEQPDFSKYEIEVSYEAR